MRTHRFELRADEPIGVAALEAPIQAFDREGAMVAAHVELLRFGSGTGDYQMRAGRIRTFTYALNRKIVGYYYRKVRVKEVCAKGFEYRYTVRSASGRVAYGLPV
jgi:hypothetical protein